MSEGIKGIIGIVNAHAAGIDIGSEKIFISVPDGPVRNFPTFTESYEEAVEYLRSHKVTTIAMEATGVYWIAFYEMLEAAGFEVCVVNAAYVRHVPGRKSDVSDCEWLRQLHTHGLLRPSFIPPDKIRELRSYVRLRDDHISLAAQHVQHMHKALELMNLKLQTVISQIQGASGMRVLRAIIGGERDPQKLLALCDKQIVAHKAKEVVASLKGNYRGEHIFALKQAVECWDFYQHQIAKCDKQIEAVLKMMTDEKKVPENIDKGKPIRHHRPNIEDLHTQLMKLTDGKNPAAMAGLTDMTLLDVLSEVGLDLTHWKTHKHFTAWAGLAPNMHQSGKSTKKRRRRVHTRVGRIFRLAAQSVGKSKNSALGAFYRRIKARRGPLVAIKATARKIAVLFYNIMTKGISYVEEGVRKYQERYEAQRIKYLSKEARKLGWLLAPIEVVHQ